MAKSVKYLLKIRQASIYLCMSQVCHLHWYLSKDFQAVSIVGISLINTEAYKSKTCMYPLRLMLLTAKNNCTFWRELKIRNQEYKFG